MTYIIKVPTAATMFSGSTFLVVVLPNFLGRRCVLEIQDDSQITRSTNNFAVFFRYKCRSKKQQISLWLVQNILMSSNHGPRYLVSKIQDFSQLTGSSNIKIPTPNSSFPMMMNSIKLAKWLRQRSTTKNYKIGAQNLYIAVSGCRSLSQLPGVALGVVENPRFAVWIVTLSVIVTEI